MTPDTTLVLGSITFQGFEIPSEIPLGGSQALSVKKQIGGVRVVDALGPDLDDIAWNGRMQGANAMSRALALDEMQRGGQQQTLTVFGLSYTVVVKSFKYRVQRTYQVLYDLVLTVVQDNSTSAPTPTSTLDDLVSSDMTSAQAIVPNVTDPTIAPAITALQTAITAAGTLQAATLTALAPVAAAAAAATAAITNSINAIDPTILTDTGAVAGVVSGGAAGAMATIFQAQQAAIIEESNLQQLVALTGRIQTNLAQATG